MDGDVVNNKIRGRTEGETFLLETERKQSRQVENDENRAGGDNTVFPRSQRGATDTYQGVCWQDALSINMLLRRNKTSPRASSLHANFIRAALQERHLCMQMRELSISKLQLVSAKCVIMDVGCLVLQQSSKCVQPFESNPAMKPYTNTRLQNEVCENWHIHQPTELTDIMTGEYNAPWCIAEDILKLDKVQLNKSRCTCDKNTTSRSGNRI